MTQHQVIEAWGAFQANAHLERPETEADYERLLELMNYLIDHHNCDEEPYASLMDLVGTYMHEYEEIHDGDLKDMQVEPHHMLEFYMDQQGVTQSQLAKEGIAAQGNLSKILAGERTISKALAKKLAARFHANVEVFL